MKETTKIEIIGTTVIGLLAGFFTVVLAMQYEVRLITIIATVFAVIFFLILFSQYVKRSLDDSLKHSLYFTSRNLCFKCYFELYGFKKKLIPRIYQHKLVTRKCSKCGGKFKLLKDDDIQTMPKTITTHYKERRGASDGK